jgi:predicted nucleic acid-binding protein
MLLRLAEGTVIQVLVSPQVLSEVEGALRRKAPDALGHLALLLDRAHCQVVPNPTWEQVNAWQSSIDYRPDAAILAAAVAAEADYVVTHDRRHLIDNSRLSISSPLPIGTPGDCLEWLRSSLISGDGTQDERYRLSERLAPTYAIEEKQ